MSAGGYKREGVSGWEATHGLVDPEDLLGLGGVRLEVFSTNGDKRQVLRCQVFRDGQPAGIANATNEFFGPKLGDLSERAHDQYFYPQDFSGAPDLPLPNGEFRVEWIAVRDNTGQQDLAFDSFTMINGHLSGAENDPEPFPWTNTYANDASEPYLQGLMLRLTQAGDRWRRGVTCSVVTPSGAMFTSQPLDLDEENSVSIEFPKAFRAPPIEDGVHRITWRGAAVDDPAVAVERGMNIRQVISLNHSSGRKTGDRFVLEKKRADQLLMAGNAKLFVDHGFTVGRWSGKPNFSCNDCKFSTLKLTELERHRKDNH